MTYPGTIQVTVDRNLCTGCGNCVRVCPTAVFDLVGRKAVANRPERCVLCELCVRNCPVNAITLPQTAPAPAPAAGVSPPPVAPPSPGPAPAAGVSPPPAAAPSPGVGIAPPPPPPTMAPPPTYTPPPPVAPSPPPTTAPSPTYTPPTPAAGLPPVYTPSPAAPPAEPNIAVPRTAPIPPPRVDWIPHVVPPPQDKITVEAPVVLAPMVVPVRKELIVLPGVCVGCQLCEMACSLTHEGIINPYLSRIKVNQIREEGIIEPTICHHCNPAPCEQACPTKALFWAPNLPGVLMFDQVKCTSCYNCVHACPFGAVQIGPRGELLKCDLCGGNPACVSVCQDRPEFHPPHWTGGRVSALAFVEPQEATRIKRMQGLRGTQKG